MTHVINEFYKARDSRFGQTLKGVGLTMEGIENNPVMYELLCELPWRKSLFTSDEWLKNYIRARYGKVTHKSRKHGNCYEPASTTALHLLPSKAHTNPFLRTSFAQGLSSFQLVGNARLL